MATTISPIIFWETHETISQHLDLARKWFDELASGAISDESWERIHHGYPPRFEDFEKEVLFLFGKAAGWQPTDHANPLKYSAHARALEQAIAAEWYFKNQVTGADGTRELGRSPEEIVAKAREASSQLAAFSDDLLVQEVPAAYQLHQADPSSLPKGVKQVARRGKTHTDGSVKPATVNERMASMLQKNPNEICSWTRHEWSQRLGCSESAVQGTKTWQLIQTMRVSEQLSRARAQDRRRK